MHDLIIDTSTATCSVSIFDNDILSASYHEFIGRGHAEVLIPSVQKILDGIIPDNIYVNIGPGSFTGIRIGISAARALSLAWNIPNYGYSTMQLMAAIAWHKANDDGILPVVDASLQMIDVIMNGGHGELYVQSFDQNINMLTPIMSLPPSDCQCTAPIRTGDKAAIAPNESGAAIIELSAPDTRLFTQLQPYKKLEVKPIYVRAPDAKTGTNATKQSC